MVKFEINLGGIEGAKSFYNLIKNFDSDIDLCIGRYVIDAKSVLGIFSLNLERNLTLVIHEKAAGEANKIYALMKENGYLVEE